RRDPAGDVAHVDRARIRHGVVRGQSRTLRPHSGGGFRRLGSRLGVRFGGGVPEEPARDRARAGLSLAAEIDSSMQAPETGRVTVAHAVRGELDADERPRVVRRSLLCCALGLAIFCLFSLRVPVSSEVRYIQSAREMVESGDWTVPHFAYVPYAEKPILLAWTSVLSRLIAGDSRVAVRLPSILAATASLLVTFLVGLRLGGLRLATRGALVLLGSSYFLLLGTVLTMDMLFSFWL